MFNLGGVQLSNSDTLLFTSIMDKNWCNIARFSKLVKILYYIISEVVASSFFLCERALI
jgi:hypothetical protein